MTLHTVRSAILSSYAQTAHAVGLDAPSMLRAVGLPRRCLASQDTLIRVGKVHQLLELSAEVSGVDDFALRLSRTRRLSGLGALGALMREEPTVRAALARSVKSLHMNSTGVWIRMDESGDKAAVRLSLELDGAPSVVQGTELAVGGLFHVLSSMHGPGWRPLEVRFVHSARRDASAHRKMFGCPVYFGAEDNAIILSRPELDNPIPLADPTLLRYGGLATQSLGTGPDGVGLMRVKEQIWAMMPLGRCTSSEVAAALGIDRRTLHRRLAQDGMNFSGVYDDVRLTLAKQHLEARVIGAAQIADMLGFSSQSTFSRWFSQTSGCAPSRWRMGRDDAPRGQ